MAWRPRVWALLAAASAVVLGGCGGGGGGGPAATGSLMAVSFLGTPAGPGLPSLPQVFRDQALEFTFDGNLDPGVFGGFFEQGGVAVTFTGVAPAGALGVPYFAFVDQNGARNSLQIRLNAVGGAMLPSYIVGRHRDKPDTIVVDPAVPAGTPLGLPAGVGFVALAQYAAIIPAGNGFSFGGHPAQPFGPGALPVPVPPFTTQPALSPLFQAGAGFGPSPIPPSVTSIVALSGAAGAPGSPVSEAEVFVVTFSRLVTLSSLEPGRNFAVRNLDVTNTTFPGGIVVPGSILPIIPGAAVGVVFLFTPASAFGPGLSPTEGYDVEVRVGSFDQPPQVIPPILGVPQGLSALQLPLSNSLSRTFRTTPCTGCQTPASVVEAFDDTAQQDATFVQTFPNTTAIPGPKQCRWNDASAPGVLAGRLTTGSPLGNNAQTLGTRIQFIVNPTPNSISPAGLFSPFDASLANSGGQCPTIPTGCNLGTNPGGGSHIMHVYEATELGSTEDSLEQVEWSPVSGVTNATTYPNYKIWCGLTSTAAPLAGGAAQGLTAVFDANYNLTPFQTGIPVQAGCAAPGAINPRKVPCGGPSPYVVMLQTTQFYPFPTLSPPFDFARADGSSGSGTNLIFEQDIDAGNQVPNFNRYRATAFNPVRRLIDKPIAFVTPGLCPFNNGGTFDVYVHRFTFVGIVAQCRSLYYDTGAANPSYIDFILTPPPSAQPPGTSSVWVLEATDAANPGPAVAGSSGVYVDASGATNPNVLTTTLAGLRYFRFRVELRGNNVTNTAPVYNGAVMAYSF